MKKRTPAEFFEWKKHTILAYCELKNETWLSDTAKNMILSHHERINGSGFPLKQRIKEVECNMIQICDAFDCMVSGIECERICVHNAIDFLTENKKILFDGDVVKQFLEMVSRYPVGTKLQLGNGKRAVVLSQTEKADRPIVGMLDEMEKLKEETCDLSENSKLSILEVLS